MLGQAFDDLFAVFREGKVALEMKLSEVTFDMFEDIRDLGCALGFEHLLEINQGLRVVIQVLVGSDESY